MVAEYKNSPMSKNSKGLFYEKSQNSKKNFTTQPTRTFRPNFLRPTAKIQNSAPNILLASFSRFQQGITWPPCYKTLGGDRFGVNPSFGVPGLTLRTLGSNLPPRKLLAKSWSDPEYLVHICCFSQKLLNIFAETHRHTDTQTEKLGILKNFIKETPPRKIF